MIRTSRIPELVKAAALAGAAYAALVLIMWVPFNPRSGLPYETGFPYMSETSSVVGGFLYLSDLLRVHTNTFYQAAYLLGEIAGAGGSYVPYQIVYALLWWARGFLVFLLLRRFLPDRSVLCYSAGALVLVHAADGALQWVGQLNQFGFIFWMLLAMYCLTVAAHATGTGTVLFSSAAACFFEHMCLWSYESPILLLLLFPVLLLVKPGIDKRRLLKILVGWYSVPAAYLGLTVLKYARTGQSYQESLLRRSWNVSSVLGDWGYNIGFSLEFWRWPRGNWTAPESACYLLGGLAALAFLGCGIGMMMLVRHREWTAESGSITTWWKLLSVGLSALVLSFPVYLLLDASRNLWRTQLLAGIGCALTLAALFGLAFSPLARWRLHVVGLLLAASVVVVYGATTAVQLGAYHRSLWDRHRKAMMTIFEIAPGVMPDIVFVVTNVPKDNDPFGDAMWLDIALRLSYPQIPVTGIYFFTDGTPGPGTNLTANGRRWKWNGAFGPRGVTDGPLNRTIAIRLGGPGGGQLLSAIPPEVCGAPCDAYLYEPSKAISSPISPRTVRRYYLDVK